MTSSATTSQTYTPIEAGRSSSETVVQDIVIDIHFGIVEVSFVGVGVISIVSLAVLELYRRKRNKAEA